LPLQPFTPKHFPSVPPAAMTEVANVPVTSNAAAVKAILAPDFRLSFISVSLDEFWFVAQGQD
jgi:hypothetical protein